MNKKLILASFALAPFLFVVGCASNGNNNTNTQKQISQDPVAVKKLIDNKQTKSKPIKSAPAKISAVTVTTNVKPAESVEIEQSEKYPTIDISEDKIEKPATMVFQFNFDKHELSNQSKAILMQHADYLKSNADLVLKITGHSDTRGPRVYNEFLSKERARAVAGMLIQYGVQPGQIQVDGKGDAEPLNDINNFAENRRVELDYLNLNVADQNGDKGNKQTLISNR